MKRIINKYRVSKFKRFMNGLVFAVIAVIALALCIADIYDKVPFEADILLPFCVAVLSLLMGFVVMFKNNGIQRDNLKYLK